jgi:hypothetical protein
MVWTPKRGKSNNNKKSVTHGPRLFIWKRLILKRFKNKIQKFQCPRISLSKKYTKHVAKFYYKDMFLGFIRLKFV